MSRSYRHIEEYTEEIMRLRAEGKTRRKIGETLGFSKEQIKNFINRYNRKQEKLVAGIVVQRKGRPSQKEAESAEQTKSAELRYLLARKEARIKQLEMENELMRDFLSLTGRK